MEPMVTDRKQHDYKKFAERLNDACKEHGIPVRGRAKALGALVGVGYKGAGKWLAGDGMPDMGHATALAVELEITFDWLMTGREPMRPGILHAAESHGKKEQPHGGGAISREVRVLADKYERLDPKQRTHVQAVVDALASTTHVKKDRSKTGNNN